MAALLAVGPGNLRWVALAVLGYGLWTGFFTWVALTRGLVTLTVAGDLVVTVALCLTYAGLTPGDFLTDGSVWAAGVGAVAVPNLPLAWRARVAIPAGVVVVATFAAFPLAGRGGLGVM